MAIQPATQFRCTDTWFTAWVLSRQQHPTQAIQLHYLYCELVDREVVYVFADPLHVGEIALDAYRHREITCKLRPLRIAMRRLRREAAEVRR